MKELGECLYLDSGTMTPLLKRLESKGYITRERSQQDERSVMIAVTEAGEALKAQAADIPLKLGACVKLEPEEAMQLHALLHKVLKGLLHKQRWQHGSSASLRESHSAILSSGHNFRDKRICRRIKRLFIHTAGDQMEVHNAAIKAISDERH